MNAEKPRMLICEDNEEVADVLREFFTRNGYEVSTAMNGNQALDLLRNHRFDVLITDIVMPVAGGMELLKQVRETGITLPVLVLSGHIGCLEPERFEELGADVVFSKPADLKAILGAVQELRANSTAARKRILIVEDNPAISTVVAKFLSRDFEVVVAENGWEALAEGSGRYDLIILDMMMPGLDGNAAFTGLDCSLEGDEIKEGKAPPTLLMTALPRDHKDVSQLLEQRSVVGYLPKPFSVDELTRAVSSALK